MGSSDQSFDHTAKSKLENVNAGKEHNFGAVHVELVRQLQEYANGANSASPKTEPGSLEITPIYGAALPGSSKMPGQSEVSQLPVAQGSAERPIVQAGVRDFFRGLGNLLPYGGSREDFGTDPQTGRLYRKTPFDGRYYL